MKFNIPPIVVLIMTTCILVLYTIAVWECAMYAIPIEQQIEINDCNQRLEDCHWHLLDRNAEIETLTKRQELDSLINQNKDD